MRSSAILAAAALAVLAAGCGQQEAGPRPAVAAYLRRVDRVERAAAGPLSAVSRVSGQFVQQQRAGGPLIGLLTVSQERTLLDAWRGIRRQQARLAAIPAPPAARRLRSLLLEIIAGQASLTRELASLVGFLPRYSAALRPLAEASRRLQAALAQAGSSTSAAAAAAKASALRQFRSTVEGVLAQLRRLKPPAVSRPAYQAQVAALSGMGQSAGGLAAALTSGTPDVQPLLASFDRAAASTQTLSAQRAEIAAIRAYDAQSERLSELSQAAEAERQHLASTLG